MSVNEQVNETLSMMDDLDVVLDSNEEARKELRRERNAYKDRRRHYFKDLPILVVGNDDVKLDKLRDEQAKLRKKGGDLKPLQIEELLHRQELQTLRKKAKRDKAKKKRKQNRYNRSRNRR